MSLNKLEMIKREVTAEVGVTHLISMLGCAELVVSINEEGEQGS